MNRTLCISKLCLLGATVFASLTFAADDPAAQDTAEKLAAARQRLEQAAREVAELSGKMGRDGLPDNLIFLGRNPNRAMLGIGFERSKSKNEEGVAVLSVSPGGPAAKAGIQAGDIVTTINGKTLKQDEQGAPHEKLLSEVAKLSPGDEVSLSYRRGDKSNAVKFKADRLAPPDLAAARMLRLREQGGPEWEHRLHEDMVKFRGARRGAFDDLELASLTPELGRYFGTEKGLLIVRAPQDESIKLEDGDVLVEIDGRTPTSPRHAFSILDSYQAGEKLSLNVLRQKKKVAVAVEVPEDKRPRRISLQRSPPDRERRGSVGPAKPFAVPLPPPSAIM